jgi:pilus assembly protein CpaF
MPLQRSRPTFNDPAQPQQQAPQQPAPQPVQPVQPPVQPARPAPVYAAEPVEQSAPLPAPRAVFDEPEPEQQYADEPQFGVLDAQEYTATEEPEPEAVGGYSNSVEDVDTADLLYSFSPEVQENALRLLDLIGGDDSSEVKMSGPDRIMFKRNGVRYRARDISFPDVKTYHQVIDAVILPNTDTADRLSTSEYRIEGQLDLEDPEDPSAPHQLARVHILAPPAAKNAIVTIAKKSKRQLRLEDILAAGSMSNQMMEFLRAAARARITIVFSGVSGSGKTTLLEAMSYYFDTNDQVIVVEDTPELRLPMAAVDYLYSTSPKPGQTKNEIITLEWQVQQTQRMRPDRVIVGECRGSEMSAFLTAANSGADGSMTTIHASSPKLALDRMALMVQESPDAANSMDSVMRNIASIVQLVVQTTLVDGRHVISGIEEITNVVNQQTGNIQRNALFAYDRSNGRYSAVGRPTDALSAYTRQRGVELDRTWFDRGV